MEIVFNNTVGKYQLKLPGSMAGDLDLVNQDGKPLEIFNENKMSLEWLYKDLAERHQEIEKWQSKMVKRRKGKLIFFGLIFLASLSAFLFSQKIAMAGNTPVSVVKLLCIVLMVISGWSVFQAYILSRLLAKENLIDNLKTIQLREQIIERFSV
jgi:hypothetical protein